MREIRQLTALRGIFAVWVMAFHSLDLSPSGHPADIFIVSRGYLAVDFFFMLSGFILTGAHAKDFGTGYAVSGHIAFLVKRVGRMYPLHLVVIAICVGVALVEGGPRYWLSWAAEALLLHRWQIPGTAANTLNGPDWSISTELAANILFPLFVFATQFWGRFSAVATSGLTMAAIVFISVVSAWHLDTPYILTRCFAEFVIGMLIYRWRGRWTFLRGDAMLGAIAASGVVLLAFPWSDMPVLATMILVLHGVSESNGRLARLLRVRPLVFLGEISFSIYLIHMPMMRLMRVSAAEIPAGPMTQAILFVVISLISVVGVSALTFRFIEAPGRDLAKRLARWINDATRPLAARAALNS